MLAEFVRLAAEALARQILSRPGIQVVSFLASPAAKGFGLDLSRRDLWMLWYSLLF